MDPVTKIKSDLAALALEAKPLAEKSKQGLLTGDESSAFDGIVERMNNARAELAEAEKQAAAATEIFKLDQQFNAAADSVKRGATEADGVEVREIARKSPGQALIESDSFKQALKAGHGVTKHNPVELPGFFGPEAQKAVIGSAGPPASALFAQVLPTIYRGLERPLVMRDVLMNLNTNSDNITVMQESGFTNSAAEVAEATAVDGTGLTGGVKPESALTFTEATFPVRTIAHWLPVTRQLLEDLAFMASYIDERLLTGLRRREDAQFLNGNGTAPNLRGILQTSGIQNLDQTYFTGAAVADAGTNNENLNRIRRAIRVIQVTGQAQPTFIVMNPVDAEKLDTASTATEKAYLLGGPLAPLPRRVWGLPIVESDNMAAGGALVGDGTMAAVVDRNQARIYTTDSHADFFVRNLFVVLAEERVALPIFRPAAFAFVDFI